MLHPPPHPKSILPPFSMALCLGSWSLWVALPGSCALWLPTAIRQWEALSQDLAIYSPVLPTSPNLWQWLCPSHWHSTCRPAPLPMIPALAASVSSRSIKPSSNKTFLRIPSATCQDPDQNNERRGFLSGNYNTVSMASENTENNYKLWRQINNVQLD